MRRLYPAPIVDVDPGEWYAAADRPRPADRPWVMLNMVASIDGATAVDGVSGGLGGAGDRAVFGAIRALPDVIMVAAGTVRAESYGPPRPSAAVRAARTARGQAAVPQLAIVTRSLDLDFDSDLFGAAEGPPIIVTTEDADPERVGAARRAGAEILAAGTDDVDLRGALGALAANGHGLVLVEGGPTLNGQLVAAGMVDEVCVTVSPKLVGGDAVRIAHGAEAVVHDFDLAHVLEHDGELCCRYVVASSACAAAF